MSSPFLYSFYRCPYAMRARLALLHNAIDIYVREVSLKDKPEDMLQYSPKGTVPVMVLPQGEIIDESLDIVKWAYKNQYVDQQEQACIDEFQENFVKHVYPWKYPERFPHLDRKEVKNILKSYAIKTLVPILSEQGCLFTKPFGQAEVVMLPFFRQAYMADNSFLSEPELEVVRLWIEDRVATTLFMKSMQKNELWNKQKNNQFLLTIND